MKQAEGIRVHFKSIGLQEPQHIARYMMNGSKEKYIISSYDVVMKYLLISLGHGANGAESWMRPLKSFNACCLRVLQTISGFATGRKRATQPLSGPGGTEFFRL
ncbi:MAG: hypothetical protein CVV27_03840 [Candidatus Melainabacteria bacterium HGW-Melainabacteria-1]|nr:MAG: hypothetical protein CVV27_03840 [Candidatus Melainabacteria bacterium HGW-Melainabacteria-1]